ncbi:hypothetical protein FKO59_30025 [Burkholderia pseudomallei]|nr:hypothetical protein F5D26_06810 [Burkholderia pseudomallei]QDH31509.1 hypothetical protein FKO42_30050 [Burkholderia pseudomallei]QDH41764.1 hypothetical protein FKO59_30025 [Burkholderia pseudomallei]
MPCFPTTSIRGAAKRLVSLGTSRASRAVRHGIARDDRTCTAHERVASRSVRERVIDIQAQTGANI